MANRFWVGGNGTWDASSTLHWSATSGGASGASAPGSADSVFIDALSGSAPVITLSNAVCLDLNLTGALNPTLAATGTLSIFGSATFILAMTITGNSNFLYSATATGKTITTNGLNIPVISIFQGVGGGWTLQDNYSGLFISHTAGTFDTNSKTVTVSSGLNSTGGATRVLSLGASVINSSGSIAIAATGLTLNAGTSSINMLGNNLTFDGGGLTYYNVNFRGTPITVIGNNTYNIRTVSAGVTVNNTAGSNQTAASFIDNGTPALAITEQSTVAGTPYTFTKTSGAVIFRHTSIKDCTATGGATFSALESSTNVSGNTGITFGVARTFMQIKPNGTYEAFYFEDQNGVPQNLSLQTSNALRQVIINGNFSVNQRGVSGTVTLAAGAYGHDRWKAGASGCTYTFVTVNNITTITITAGSLIQVIEGVNLYSGTYVLSWTGTAQGRVGTGNYSASSVTTSVIGGTNLNVEFNAGTLSKVQFNAGDTALPFQPKSYNEELTACQRFYENSYADGAAVGTADGYDQMMGSLVAADTNSLLGSLSFKVRKRVNPTITLRAANVATGSGTLSNVRDDSVGGLLNVSGCAFLKSQWGIRRISLAASFVANHTYAFSWESDAEL